MVISSRYEKFLFSEGIHLNVAVIKRDSHHPFPLVSPKQPPKYLALLKESSLESTHMPTNQVSLPEYVLHFFLNWTNGDCLRVPFQKWLIFFWFEEIKDEDVLFTLSFNVRGFEAFSSSKFSLGIVPEVPPSNGNIILFKGLSLIL